MRDCQHRALLYVVVGQENHPAPPFQKPKCLQELFDETARAPPHHRKVLARQKGPAAGGRGDEEINQKKKTPKRVLQLPDLDYTKRAVLNTLGSPESKRAYQFAIEDFVIWYCSEPRLAFSKTVVMRYRLELEARQLAPATLNLRLAAVRR